MRTTTRSFTFQTVTTMSHKMQNRPSVASKSKVGGGEKKTKRRMSKAPSEDLTDIHENNETATNKTQGKKRSEKAFKRAFVFINRPYHIFTYCHLSVVLPFTSVMLID